MRDRSLTFLVGKYGGGYHAWDVSKSDMVKFQKVCSQSTSVASTANSTRGIIRNNHPLRSHGLRHQALSPRDDAPNLCSGPPQADDHLRQRGRAPSLLHPRPLHQDLLL